MVKTEHRIPTTQFGYISVFVENGEELTPEMIQTSIDDHRRLHGAYNASGGIPVAEFESFIQRQMEGQGNTIEVYEKMSPEQQAVVQMIKRLKKRINYKIRKDKE